MMEFYDTKINNVHIDGMANLIDPPTGWGNVKDCGKGFPCTAPKNVVYSFKNTVWTGTSPLPAWQKANF
jgi:hypothetical protein